MPPATAAASTAAKKTSSRFVKNWLSDSATYPLIAIMAGACVLCTFAMTRQLLTHPDVNVDKNKRSLIVRENKIEGERHHDHALRKIGVKRGEEDKIRIFPNWEKRMLEAKLGDDAPAGWKKEDDEE